jgi:hypothetical protein
MKHMAYGQRNLNNRFSICFIYSKKTIQEFSMCKDPRILWQNSIQNKARLNNLLIIMDFFYFFPVDIYCTPEQAMHTYMRFTT